MKKGNLGKLALIAGGLYAVKALADKNKEETALNNIFAGLPQNATAESGEIPFSPDQFKKWIDANPALKAALRSGVTAEQVVNQINQNVYQLDNVEFERYSQSLILNGAIELENNDFWPDSIFPTDLFEGMPVLGFSNVGGYNSKRNWINTDYLHKVQVYIKTENGAAGIFVLPYAKDGTTIVAKSNSVVDTTVLTGINNVNFEKKTAYFGGKGILASNLSPNAVKFRIGFSVSNGVNVYFSKLVVTKVDFGEPVPYNLPWLPAGQEVIDPTTGDRGNFDGTAVNWYTMAV